MIPFDFAVYKPTTVEEAIQAYKEAAAATQPGAAEAGAGREGGGDGGNGAGRKAADGGTGAKGAGGRGQSGTGSKPDIRYYSGGTEIVTLARDGKLTPTALIDTKLIEQTRGISIGNRRLRIGAGTSLTDAVESNALPLLSKAAGRIADRTVRNSITIGGNIMGMLPYREAVLPFLVFDGDVEIAGPDGMRTVPIAEVFKYRMKLADGEFVVAFGVDESAVRAPIFYRRREKDPRVDYPLVTLAAAVVDGQIRFAVSGAFNGPIRSDEAEKVVNEAVGGTRSESSSSRSASGDGGSGRPGGPSTENLAAVSEQAADAFGTKFRSDFRGSPEYRRALLALSIQEMITELAK